MHGEISNGVHTAFQKVAPFSKAAFNGLIASSCVIPPNSVRAVQVMFSNCDGVSLSFAWQLTHHAIADGANRLSSDCLGGVQGRHFVFVLEVELWHLCWTSPGLLVWGRCLL